jgi:hypothetical protein
MSRRAWACGAGAVGLAFGAWFWLATPRQMHQLSGTVMEIRSAGPDRRMWTADDLVVK